MSIYSFIASDVPLPEFAPPREYPVIIDVDHGRTDDGGANDNYYLIPFDGVRNYTGREYGVRLEWEYTDGRASQIIEYIKTALKQTDRIEFWKIWLMDYYEYEERPFVHRKTVSIEELTTAHIRQVNDAEIWNTPDRMYPERPSFYCLTISA